jgi:putative ABC transport system permease protein
MFSHLFKLIWNKKKQNALLIIEMFVSFIVMFAVFTLVVYCYKNYRNPMGFDYKDVWVANFTPPENIKRNDSIAMFQDALKRDILAMGPVKELSFTSGNVPFSMSTNNTMVGYGKRMNERSNIYQVQSDYKNVLNVHVLEGRWFNDGDLASKLTPIVINNKLKEELFGNEDAIGKTLTEEDFQIHKQVDRFKVIGVVNNLKDKGDYQALENGVYMRIDSNWARWSGTMLLKVQPGTDAEFESKLFKKLSSALGTSIEIEHLEKKLPVKNKVMLVPIIIGIVVAAFLIINVALGLFGVLWYNINKRRGEIGLRRAVGASGNSISWQLVGEAMVLSTLSLILGSFFAVQFPLLNVFDLASGTYITAIILSIAFIYLLVLFCALYPGKQAAAIYPAVALHEE